MKPLFYYFLLLIPITACSQENITDIQGMDIQKGIKELKSFDQQPIYQIRVNSGYAYAVLINEIPLINKNTPHLTHYLTEINSCIPESGNQTIEIKVYPRSADMDTSKPDFEQAADFKLVIEKTAWKDGVLEEPETIYTYSLPSKEHGGEQSLVHIDTFYAAVPYQLIDWRKGNTFTGTDTSRLKEKAVKAYQSIISYYENQAGEDYVNAIGKGLFNLYQASYFTQDEALDHVRHSIAFVNKEERRMENLKNYELQVRAGGKLLSLRRTDGLNRGEGVIRRTYKKGQKQMVHIYDILLYAPPSTSEAAPLEVIWHNNLVRGVD